MAKWFWGLLFGITNLVCLFFFVASPFLGWWLPEGVSTHSGHVDHLFYVILAVTGFFFILTEALLAYFLVRFGARTAAGERSTPGEHRLEATVVDAVKKVIPNEQRLELAWTIVPAAILLYVAIAQIGTWAEIKYTSSMPNLFKTDESPAPLQVAVSARQFEWRMRYPSPETWRKMNPPPDVWRKMSDDEKEAAKRLARNWHKFPQADDVHVANELHVWTNPEKVSEYNQTGDYTLVPATVVHLSTIDVQHNLNIPHFRVKQDALPGKVIPVWFRPTKANGRYNKEKHRWEYKVRDRITGEETYKSFNYVTFDPETGRREARSLWDEESKARLSFDMWEIACAELCGRWHYHMIGRVFVHPSEESFLAWLSDAAKSNTQRTRTIAQD